MVDTNMTFSLISSRDTETNIMFTIQFTVSHGPPSTVVCNIEGLTKIHKSRQNPSILSREVIRSHYINSSYPDMTRVTLTLTSTRQPRTYTCNVTVEGRVNIVGGIYNFANKGNGTTTVSITGECVTVVLNSSAHYSSPLPPPPPSSPPPPPPPPLLLLSSSSSFSFSSSQLQAPPLVSLPTGLVTPVLVSPGLPHQQEHHQLAMRCSIS